MVMSLDGFVCGENNELDWEEQDPLVSMYLIPKLLERVDTMFLGRALYEGFEQAWPAMARDPQTPQEIKDFARWVQETPKVVFSDSLKDCTWDNSTLVNVKNDQDIANQVSRLKQQAGKDIVVFGGAQFARTLVKMGLVDEFQLKVQPVVLGTGKALFSSLTERLKLKLVDSKAFDSGVIAVTYAPVL